MDIGSMVSSFMGGASKNDTAAPSAPQPVTGGQIVGTVLQDIGQGIAAQPTQSSDQSKKGNSYGALFGGFNKAIDQRNAAPPVPMAAPTMPISTLAAPPPVAPIAQVQAPMPAPMQSMAPTMSDMMQKYKIQIANKELNQFLNKVYTNVTRKK